MKSLFVTAASLLCLAAPAAAISVDLTTGGQWNGKGGYYSSTQTFILPKNATNVMLNVANFGVDDRGILSFNGSEIDAVGIRASVAGTIGSFNFSQAGPTVSHLFVANSSRNTIVTNGFNVGAPNTLLFQGNDTSEGIYGNVLDVAINASWGYAATLTYDLNGAVPEPATWGMMILGFGIMGAAMRRRRNSVLTA